MKLASALCGVSGRCTKCSIAACGTLALVLLRLVCDPVRVRGAGEENAGDENCGRSGVKGRIPRLLDVLAG